MSDSELGIKRQIDSICDEFEARWPTDGRNAIRSLIDRVAPEHRQQLLKQLVAVDVELRAREDETIVADDYQYLGELAVGHVESLLKGNSPTRAMDSEDAIRDFTGRPDDSDKTLAPKRRLPTEQIPAKIGRYQIESVLGKGGFGLVYKAYDEQLQRHVAVKIPHAHLVNEPADAQVYLTEARTVANLDHPNIVPVHDVGQNDEFPCYVVSRFIEGTDLANRIKQQPLAIGEAVELVATIAEALHYAHKQGLVHRDVKPGNILLGSDGKPYLVDFGLALNDQKVGTTQYAGTPAYMSPEQARGEGHRVDGRSDIYSLGVVLYELLTGKRTFSADSAVELLKKVSSLDVKPPRQINDAVPRELERICLKSLSRRASDRYTTALDLADDLRHFLRVESSKSLNETGILREAGQKADSTKAGIDSATPQFNSDSREIRVVPKGLRSFDAHDADFFLELLPGPRDRDGLPDSIRFWKTKIEESDPDHTFSIGLIYGPSGCGKSSLVKAGLIPRLSDQVIPIYIEATPEETESRLLRGLRKACPHVDQCLSLVDSLTAIRQGLATASGKKVLIVLDQFEQWLHAKKEDVNTELVQAMRQCDGEHVQCVVMVRDDFWMAATRFMRELEVRLAEAENSAAADLFPIRHAEKVLQSFGRAFGALGSKSDQLSTEQEQFIKHAAAGLSEEGKVICVRLALFAEMMKGESWTPDTLAKVGGTSGVGVTFLEETFSATTAPPEHRYHQKAARAVLMSLLPNSGTDIKGQMLSRDDLLEVSGYENRPQNFNELIRILDREIRLITPTDHDGKEFEEDAVTAPTDAGKKYYQLTHDYLVPSLRDWLTRKQRESRQGRAELTLADRSAVWQARPENRQLPSLWQWLQIRRYTRARNWTESQRKMMSQATKVHGLRTVLACAMIFVVVAIGWQIRQEVSRGQEETRIRGLVNSLINAEPNQLPEIVAELDESPELASTLLNPLISKDAQTPDEKRAQLHARMASVSRDPSLVVVLKVELLTNKPAYIGPIREMLCPYADNLILDFWEILRNEVEETNERRFRAAMALAEYLPDTEKDSWTKQDLDFVGRELVSSNAEFQPLLRRNLQPISERLLPAVEAIFRDQTASESQRLSAANALADYASEDTERLANLLTFATPEQFSVLFPLVAANPTATGIENLARIASTLPPNDLGSVERIAFGQRRANAAVTLLRMGEIDKALNVFEWTDDPEALTQFVFRCRERGVGFAPLLDCLRIVDSAPADRFSANTRYGLLLALGEFKLNEIPESQRDKLLSQIADWYANDPSAGVHGAAGWLLRHWGQTETARKIEQTEVPYSPDRGWFTLKIEVQPKKPDGGLSSQQRQPPKKTFHYTFVVFQPGKYSVGSVENEPNRQKNELRHQVELTRPFAVLDREITLEELIAFSPKYTGFMQSYDAIPGDAGFGADWYDSVGFSRWLGKQMGLPEDQQAYASPDSLDEEKYPKEPDPAANWAPRNWPVDLGRQGFRLPTESEWEVVARAGSRTAYGFGNDVGLLGEFGWFMENSGKQVHRPRELRPGLNGLFDIQGNLFEWTHDWLDHYEADNVTDPLGPTSDLNRRNRVHRGGSWGSDATACRSPARDSGPPVIRAVDTGFRLALNPTVAAPEAEQAEPGGAKGAPAEQRPEKP